ncbi:MAG: phosphatidylglycerophosphatase A family protein [Thermoanaerobaculum sp.]
MRFLARILATVGLLGELVPAPGTFVGSLAGVLVFLWLPRGWEGVAAGVALTLVAPAVCGREARRRGETDPSSVVLDEVVGQWWALQVMAWAGVPARALWVFLGFALFRVADVVKPPPVRQAERLPGGLGIVADDLVAGVLAGVLGALAFFLAGRF